MVLFLTNLLGFCIFCVALLLTFHSHSWMHHAFTYLSYYIILALTITWTLTLIQFYIYKKFNALNFLQCHWKAILVSVLMTSVVFITVPKYFRVLSDETNLLSVAKSMTFNRTVENVTEGNWYYGMFWPIPTTGTEKRPFLFPFVESLTHTLLGYHIENVFILNYFVLWVMLFLLYVIVQSSLGDLWAISSLVLVLSQPIITLSATSGSFEIFNSLFIIVSFLALRSFLKDPGHKTFILLVLTLVMLANIRYESVLFLIITVLVVGFSGYVKTDFFSQSIAYALVPFFMLPLIWQRILLASVSDPNLTGGSWIKAFRFENVQHNIVLFFKYIFDVSGQLGFAGVINIVGILALILLGIQLLIGQINLLKNGLVLLLCSLSCLIVFFLILMFYQGGINDHPLNGRLYIPILITFSIAPVFFLANIIKNGQKSAWVVLVCSLAVFAYYHPIAVEDRLTNNLTIIREYRFVDDFLKKNADRNTLIICGRPGQLIVSNYGAISYSTANRQVNTILGQLNNHLFSKIFVVQSIAYGNLTPLNDNIISPLYHLESLDELQISGSYFFRISRVKIAE